MEENRQSIVRKATAPHPIRRAFADALARTRAGLAEVSGAFITALAGGAYEIAKDRPAGLIALGAGLVGAAAVLFFRFAYNLWLAPARVEAEQRAFVEAAYGRLQVQVERLGAEAAGLRKQLSDIEAARLAEGHLVSVAPFHSGTLAQVFVTNQLGVSDEFTAQLLGWGSKKRPASESNAAWNLRWHGEDGRRVTLHPGEKARLDLIEIVHHEPDESPLPNRYSLRLPSAIDWAGEQYSWSRYEKVSEIDPQVSSFLVRFTAGSANAHQDVRFNLTVFGRAEDHPGPGVRFITTLQRPLIWLEVVEAATTP